MEREEERVPPFKIDIFVDAEALFRDVLFMRVCVEFYRECCMESFGPGGECTSVVATSLKGDVTELNLGRALDEINVQQQPFGLPPSFPYHGQPGNRFICKVPLHHYRSFPSGTHTFVLRYSHRTEESDIVETVFSNTAVVNIKVPRVTSLAFHPCMEIDATAATLQGEGMARSMGARTLEEVGTARLWVVHIPASPEDIAAAEADFMREREARRQMVLDAHQVESVPAKRKAPAGKKKKKGKDKDTTPSGEEDIAEAPDFPDLSKQLQVPEHYLPLLHKRRWCVQLCGKYDPNYVVACTSFDLDMNTAPFRIEQPPAVPPPEGSPMAAMKESTKKKDKKKGSRDTAHGGEGEHESPHTSHYDWMGNDTRCERSLSPLLAAPCSDLLSSSWNRSDRIIVWLDGAHPGKLFYLSLGRHGVMGVPGHEAHSLEASDACVVPDGVCQTGVSSCTVVLFGRNKETLSPSACVVNIDTVNREACTSFTVPLAQKDNEDVEEGSIVHERRSSNLALPVIMWADSGIPEKSYLYFVRRHSNTLKEDRSRSSKTAEVPAVAPPSNEICRTQLSTNAVLSVEANLLDDLPLPDEPLEGDAVAYSTSREVVALRVWETAVYAAVREGTTGCLVVMRYPCDGRTVSDEERQQADQEAKRLGELKQEYARRKELEAVRLKTEKKGSKRKTTKAQSAKSKKGALTSDDRSDRKDAPPPSPSPDEIVFPRPTHLIPVGLAARSCVLHVYSASLASTLSGPVDMTVSPVPGCKVAEVFLAFRKKPKAPPRPEPVLPVEKHGGSQKEHKKDKEKSKKEKRAASRAHGEVPPVPPGNVEEKRLRDWIVIRGTRMATLRVEDSVAPGEVVSDVIPSSLAPSSVRLLCVGAQDSRPSSSGDPRAPRQVFLCGYDAVARDVLPSDTPHIVDVDDGKGKERKRTRKEKEKEKVLAMEKEKEKEMKSEASTKSLSHQKDASTGSAGSGASPPFGIYCATVQDWETIGKDEVYPGGRLRVDQAVALVVANNSQRL